MEIGPFEIIVVAAIALIVFGPQKLPEIARTVGRTLAQFRRMAEDVRSEFRDGLTIPEDDRIRPEGERPEPERLTPAVRALVPEDAEPGDGGAAGEAPAPAEDVPTQDLGGSDRRAAPDA